MDIEGEVIEQPEIEEVEVAEQGENVTDVGDGAPEDAGLVVELAGEGEDEGAPEWVKNVRRENRELKKRLKAIEESKAAPEHQALPPEPQLEDFDYDAEAFKAAHKDWVKQSIEHERQQEAVKEQQAKAQHRWESRLAFYDEAKEKLGVQDYDDAEAIVSEVLAAPFPGIMAQDVRLGIIKQGAKDPAALVYALAKNPAKAKELAAIEDPVEFAWKASALEAGMKFVRGKAPPPEKRLSPGVAGVAGALDNTLERLRAEAEKTGDYTQVAKYKRTLRG